MKNFTLALILLATAAFIGCTDNTLAPEDATLTDLNFAGYEEQILSQDLPSDTMFVITYDCDNNVTGAYLDDEYLAPKDGEDDTVVRVTLTEVKSLFQ